MLYAGRTVVLAM